MAEGLFEGLLPTAVGAAGAAAMAGSMNEIGSAAKADMNTLGTQMQTDTAFTGHGITAGDTVSTIGSNGGLDLGVGMNTDRMTQATADYNAGMTGMGSALTMAGAAGSNAQLPGAINALGGAQSLMDRSSGNPAYDQAMSGMTGAQGGLTAASGLAGANASNAQMGNAMGYLGGAGAGLANAQQGALGASQQAMANSMQDTGAREQQVYDRMMAAQQPGLNRQASAMEARAHAQGRGGIAGSQYGGSGEQFAMGRAQAEAQNSAMLGAMGQAQQEMMNQGSLASQYGQMGNMFSGSQAAIGNSVGALGAQNAQLGQSAAGLMGNMANMGGAIAGQMGQLGQGQAQLGQSAAAGLGSMANMLSQWGSTDAQLGQGAAGVMGNIGANMSNAGLQGQQNAFLEMQNQLNAVQTGQKSADMAQTGQIAGANLAAQLGLGGIQAEVNANKAASELYGNTLGAMMGPLGQLGGVVDAEGVGGLFDSIMGGLFGDGS